MYKKDYFIKNAENLNLSLSEYFKNTPYNYIIMENDYPYIWEEDNTPVIFGGIEDYMNCLENVKDMSKIHIITEWEFLTTYCMNELENFLIETIKENGLFDGNCYIVYMKNNLNNIINIDNIYTDILSAYVGVDNKLSILISDKDDLKQTFVNIEEFDILIILKIVLEIL